MKKSFVFGSLLAAFLIMTLPSICAVESGRAIESIKLQRPIIKTSLDIDKLIKKYKDNPIEPTIFILFFLTQIIRLLRIIKFTGILAIILIILLIVKSSNNITGLIS